MICGYCGSEFVKVQARQVYCSSNCRTKAYHRRHRPFARVPANLSAEEIARAEAVLTEMRGALGDA
jgi:hypothetical protein